MHDSPPSNTCSMLPYKLTYTHVCKVAKFSELMMVSFEVQLESEFYCMQYGCTLYLVGPLLRTAGASQGRPSHKEACGNEETLFRHSLDLGDGDTISFFCVIHADLVQVFSFSAHCS